MQSVLALLLATIFAFSLAGCDKDTPDSAEISGPPAHAPMSVDSGKLPSVPPPNVQETPAEDETPAPKPETEVVEEPPVEAQGSAETVYTVGGLEIAVPSEYDSELIGETELDAWSDHLMPLISFSERASVEAQQNHPDEEEGNGWLGTVVRLDQIGFEAWAASGEATDDASGTYLFAKGGGSYYLMMHPTDTRFYRSDDANNDQALAQWTQLSDWAVTLPGDMIARNGLTAYDASDLFDMDYTYGGEHKDLGYAFPGDPMDLVILALSQPARQGEGGVWCVERVRYVYSEYDMTDTHLVFPAVLGIEMAAADYYAQLQSECDAGEHPELLTPEGAALDYARRAAWLFGEDVSATDFEEINTLG